jgi:hypothetical protein
MRIAIKKHNLSVTVVAIAAIFLFIQCNNKTEHLSPPEWTQGHWIDTCGTGDDIAAARFTNDNVIITLGTLNINLVELVEELAKTHSSDNIHLSEEISSTSYVVALEVTGTQTTKYQFIKKSDTEIVYSASDGSGEQSAPSEFVLTRQ